jgi:hypothetical protein
MLSYNPGDIMKSAIHGHEPKPFEHSRLVQEIKDERDEILRLKWLESEKAHHDIGFEKALLRWVIRHRSTWLEQRRRIPFPTDVTEHN